jgi:hypothetical protein
VSISCIAWRHRRPLDCAWFLQPDPSMITCDCEDICPYPCSICWGHFYRFVGPLESMQEFMDYGTRSINQPVHEYVPIDRICFDAYD